MTAMVRAIRGATTIDTDTPEEIRQRTQALISQILERNALAADDLVSVILTSTPDLHSYFPATAARDLGLEGVPLLGSQEIDVVGALPRCIRVLVHCYSERSKAEIAHVYLEGARVLRTDLAG
ncbi:MAG TPA: chorismate mutase [Acidimicrobiales bacterium]|jgi:chorismate mutase|nr:chorismate mutase [Acidimicrobiales bacterium]